MKIPSQDEYNRMTAREKRTVRDYCKANNLPVPHGLIGKPGNTKGRPSPLKGKSTGPNGTKGLRKPWLEGLKPARWKTGPDPARHAMYMPYLKAKAQARYRGELWELTFEDFEAIWAGQFHLRGRDGDDLCMSMDDPEAGWTTTNAIILTRREVNKRSGAYKRGMPKRIS